MCGIAGLITTDTTVEADFERRLAAMQKALLHRGPDGSGSYTSPSKQAFLAHTRLSIIDLSESGSQPMLSECGRYSITFNGEIYNYQQLRQQLEVQGQRFSSDSDTEVLLRLFQLHGQACLAHLRGMFAFVIWDDVEKCAFGARDPLGIKPLYFTHAQDGALGFASELRSLLKAEMHTDELSADGLHSYLVSGTVSEPHCLLKSIHLLPAGHYFYWKNNNLETNQYWKPEFTPVNHARQKAIEITKSALEDSVKAHFVSDVPVGIFLSGGIDSTTLVAIAKKVTNCEINTYSIAFESPEWNEGDIAQKVADHFGTNHTEFLLKPQRAKELFHEFLEVVDQPTIDGFNTYCVSRLASEAGEKVVLSGVGGDELFAGYKSFELLPKMQKMSQRTAIVSGLFAFINKLTAKYTSGKTQRTLDFLSNPTLQHAYRSLRGIFSVSEANTILKAYHCDPLSVNSHTALSKNGNVADAISEMELCQYMRNQLLRDSDVMSMACGLELRVPFVDQKLFEEVSQIPAGIRLEYGKKLLVEAVPELPEWVVNRPKQGFRFPFDEWFNQDWQDLELPSNIPSWIKLQPWYRRWSLLVLNDWIKRYAS